MPSNITQTPRKKQATRQDFTEELFLNAAFQWNDQEPVIPEGNYLARIGFNITAGYFELPN